jgi:hypothetical protein
VALLCHLLQRKVEDIHDQNEQLGERGSLCRSPRLLATRALGDTFRSTRVEAIESTAQMDARSRDTSPTYP